MNQKKKYGYHQLSTKSLGGREYDDEKAEMYTTGSATNRCQ